MKIPENVVIYQLLFNNEYIDTSKFSGDLLFLKYEVKTRRSVKKKKKYQTN